MKFAARGSHHALAFAHQGLGDLPGGLVPASPKRAAWMHQQDLEASISPAVKQDAGAQARHGK
jgi:hypothetical protein